MISALGEPNSDWSRPASIHYEKEGRRVTTSGELWARVDATAEIVRSKTAPRELVLVVGANCPEAMAFFLGVIVAGRTASFFPPPNPIQDSTYYREQQAAAIASISPAMIVTFDEVTARTLRNIDPDFETRHFDGSCELSLGHPFRAKSAFLARINRGDPADIIFIQHSSGTTGQKKACPISGHLLRMQYEAYWPIVKSQSKANPISVATWLPLYHDMGLIAAFLLPIIDGACIVAVDAFDWVASPQLFLDAIEAERCQVAWMPNFAYRHYTRLRAHLRQRDLSSLRMWVSCSEPCRQDDLTGFERAYSGWGVEVGSVVGCYAMAETVFALTQASAAEPSLTPPAALSLGDAVDGEPSGAEASRKVASSGSALPGVELAIMHDNALLPESRYGEILVRAPFLFGGYVGKSANDSGITSRGFFRTGDLGTIVGGLLYVFGRLKEVVIVNGKNIHVGEVEATVSAVDGVKPGRVVVFGLENDVTGSEDLIIVAEVAQGATSNYIDMRREITALINQCFGVKPADVQMVSERWLVKSTAGKISRQANKMRYLEMTGKVGAE